MKKLYQSSWHGIPFNSFSETSLHTIAGTEFYEKFYTAFFQRYRHASDLDPEWLRLKQATIERLRPILFPSKRSHILSIGCGLGIIERYLVEQGYTSLDVCEVSETPLKWIREFLPGDQIHIGRFPNCLPPNNLYDCILLSSVDYTFEENELPVFLKNVQSRLLPGGTCSLLAYSLEPSDGLHLLKDRSRDLIVSLLDSLRRRNPKQFWGYVRRQTEYQSLFIDAGFEALSDEIIATGTRWTTYRITGQRPAKAASIPSLNPLKEVNA